MLILQIASLALLAVVARSSVVPAADETKEAENGIVEKTDVSIEHAQPLVSLDTPSLVPTSEPSDAHEDDESETTQRQKKSPYFPPTYSSPYVPPTYSHTSYRPISAVQLPAKPGAPICIEVRPEGCVTPYIICETPSPGPVHPYASSPYGYARADSSSVPGQQQTQNQPQLIQPGQQHVQPQPIQPGQQNMQVKPQQFQPGQQNMQVQPQPVQPGQSVPASTQSAHSRMEMREMPMQPGQQHMQMQQISTQTGHPRMEMRGMIMQPGLPHMMVQPLPFHPGVAMQPFSMLPGHPRMEMREMLMQPGQQHVQMQPISMQPGHPRMEMREMQMQPMSMQPGHPRMEMREMQMQPMSMQPGQQQMRVEPLPMQPGHGQMPVVLPGQQRPSTLIMPTGQMNQLGHPMQHQPMKPLQPVKPGQGPRAEDERAVEQPAPPKEQVPQHARSFLPYHLYPPHYHYPALPSLPHPTYDHHSPYVSTPLSLSCQLVPYPYPASSSLHLKPDYSTHSSAYRGNDEPSSTTAAPTTQPPVVIHDANVPVPKSDQQHSEPCTKEKSNQW